MIELVELIQEPLNLSIHSFHHQMPRTNEFTFVVAISYGI